MVKISTLLLILIFTPDCPIDFMLITESQNRRTPVNMAEDSNSGDYPTSSKKMRMDTGRITKH